MRALIAAVLVALLCAMSGGQAAAQRDPQPPPTDLWNEYPLEDQKAPSPRSQGQERGDGGSAPSASSSGDGEGQSEASDLPYSTVLAAAAGLLILIVGGLYARRLTMRRRRDRRLGERLSAPAAHDVGVKPLLSLRPDPLPGHDGPHPDIQAEAPADPIRPLRPFNREAAPPVHLTDLDQSRVEGNGSRVVESNGRRPQGPETRPDHEPDRAEQPDDKIVARSMGEAPPANAAPQPPEEADGDLVSAPASGPVGEASEAPQKGRAIGYSSVERGAGPQGESSAQADAIEAACERLGLEFVELVHDTEPKSGSDLKRPGLMYALERISVGDASCIVVPRLDRLARSAADLGSLMEWFGDKGARLVALDIGLDTDNAEGQLAARALATVGGLERQRLGERTRKGLEAARTKRRSSGRPAVSDRPALKERITALRADGMTLQAIADTLNEEGVPTLRGGSQWRPSSVQAAAGYKRPNRKNELTGLPGSGRSEAADDGADGDADA